MNNDALLLIARMDNETAKLKKMLSRFDSDFPAIGPEEPSEIHKAAIGYALHNFYNGCENIFRNISRYYENNLSDARYHKDLLERMTLCIPRIRPRVISDELYILLGDFLAFRHKFRHMYSFEINWQKEKQVVEKFPHTRKLFFEEITQFRDLIEESTIGE